MVDQEVKDLNDIRRRALAQVKAAFEAIEGLNDPTDDGALDGLLARAEAHVALTKLHAADAARIELAWKACVLRNFETQQAEGSVKH